ncbi:MAG: efflux RND transporter permease subunit [Myxococcota bacterium]
MRISDICIERPVLTWMLTLSLIVFGVLGYLRLGVDQLPNMEFPRVTVVGQMEGASPEVMEEDVTEVLEEYINTIGGLRSLRSTTGQGSSTIVAEFDLARDIDQAVQDVRDKVAAARFQLPKELEPPVIQKADVSSHPILWIPLTSTRSPVENTTFLKYTAKPFIETVPGVASVEIFGRRERAIRIWLDGDALRARGLAASDVIAALGREHVDVPAGRIESQHIEYSVKTDAEYKSVEALKRLVLEEVDGAQVRLMDVARVEDGAEDARHKARFNALDGAGLGIRKQSQANTVAIADAVRDRMATLKQITPSGMAFPEWDQIIDFSQSIRQSVAETQFALWFGALLAVLTVFVFLRRTRPTLVIATTIPLSITATFGAMWLFDVTLNIMTLLALTLAVGVVIDDAIVVLENIERHRAAGEGAREAASSGTRQIAFAATAATVSIAVVFLPVVFIKGIVGSFLGEFGLTVAAAVLFSLFVALTLVPMLAARMPPPRPRAPGSVYALLERGFAALEKGYRAILAWALDHRGLTLGGALASFVLALVIGHGLGSEFFPQADSGRIFVMVETPPGTSLEGTEGIVHQAEKFLLAQPEVSGLFAGVGIAGPRGAGSVTTAVMIGILEPQSERERSSQELILAARSALDGIPGATIRVFDPSGMFSGGSRGDVEFHLRGQASLAELDSLSAHMIRELRAQGGFVDLSKDLRIGLPEIRVIPDREKAAALGVDARAIATVIRATIGGLDVGTYKEGGHRYQIRMRLEEDQRSSPESIRELYVRAADGSPVELRNLVRVEASAAPATISRFNRQRSVTISANLERRTVDEAIEVIRAQAASLLPPGVTLSFGGSAEAFLEGLRQFGLAIGLAVLVIYMVLAAQFEHLLHPFTVMLALPLSMVGALGALRAFGMTLNLYSLIGIILLFGLVTKNSILLVDFASQLRRQGQSHLDAMAHAAPIRMRPVLMTAISMIFGVLPAAIGVGPGAESRQPMAVAAAAGMLSSTLLTLVVVPVFFVSVGEASDRVARWLRRSARSEAPLEPVADDRG